MSSCQRRVLRRLGKRLFNTRLPTASGRLFQHDALIYESVDIIDPFHNTADSRIAVRVRFIHQTYHAVRPFRQLAGLFPARHGLRVDTERCVRCGRCQDVCPVDLPIYQQSSSGACIRCMRCLSECPTGAISVGKPAWSLEADQIGQPTSPR